MIADLGRDAAIVGRTLFEVTLPERLFNPRPRS
jgi:hypothetical protein